MRTVTAMDLRKRLGEILDAASAGERILIERDHRPLAYLVSVEEGQRIGGIDEDRRKRRLAAIDRLEAFAAEMSLKHPLHPGDPDAATLVRMDRDRDEPGHESGS
jgi:prevent-host-death family protein